MFFWFGMWGMLMGWSQDGQDRGVLLLEVELCSLLPAEVHPLLTQIKQNLVFLGKQHWLQTLIPAPNLPLVCYIKIQHNSWWLNVVSVSSGNVTSFGTSKNYLTGTRHPPFTSLAKSCDHNWDLKGQYLISRGTRQHFKTRHSWDVGDVKKQVLPGFWSKDQALRGSSSNSSWLGDLGFCGLKNWKEDF